MGIRFNIYYDMDNTIARFSEGKTHEKIVVEELMYKEGFFRSLKPISNAKEVINQLIEEDKHEVFILSACLNTEYCRKEKSEWLDKHLPNIKKENIIFSDVGEDKTKYIKTPISESILIDDFYKNILDWEEKGGIAVKKRDSMKEGYEYIIRNHCDIFQILDDLIKKER